MDRADRPKKLSRGDSLNEICHCARVECPLNMFVPYTVRQNDEPALGMFPANRVDRRQTAHLRQAQLISMMSG